MRCLLGETTVSNEVLDTVLKAGEVLKIRGLWRQTEEGTVSDQQSTVEKTTPPSPNVLNKSASTDANNAPKIAVKKDDKLLKTFTPMGGQNMTRPMFIGPPKLVFIKTTEGGQAGLRPLAPKTILVTSDMNKSVPTTENNVRQVMATTTTTTSVASEPAKSKSEGTPPRILKKPERKYGKRTRLDKSAENDKNKEGDDEKTEESTSKEKESSDKPLVCIKDEPEWDASSIEEEERSIAELFHTEMNIKPEPDDDMDPDDELVYSPLTCELCAEVFTVPAAWVRHIEGHAAADPPITHARKRKHRSASDDTEETMALLRCDLCQKHFPNPAEWVRHIQSTHTEVEGAQNKTCPHCKKTFPSHASMLIHMRTHTGERPFVCGLCNKGFNVKSNLLRHLRTLHDTHVSPGQVGDDDDEIPSTSGEQQDLKPES